MAARTDEVRGWLESRADEMAGLLEQLVALDTENPPGRRLGECASVLRDAMGGLGIPAEVVHLAATDGLEDEPCIVRGSAGDGASSDGSRTIYFHGHFDVVPAQRRDQFSPQRRDGRITGRGSADMKGGLVSMLYGAVATRELGLLGDGRVVFHFVCDEETGSAVGSGHLREAGLIDPAALAMLTAEPTGGVVWHASRGAITMRVELRGREAHVGQAHLGVNAFEQMIRVAAPLADLAQDLLERRGSMLVVGGAAGAGANFNVVPGSAWFSVDRRFNPEEDLDEEVARLTDTINEAATAAGADVAIEVLQRQPSGSTDETQAAAVTLARCIAEVEGEEAAFEVCPGSLDTRWYAQLGIPAFAYGAGRLDVSHGPDEFIDEAAMRRCAEVYARFAGGLLG
jgi:succinyl-diaminopimelate desuccinylase